MERDTARRCAAEAASVSPGGRKEQIGWAQELKCQGGYFSRTLAEPSVGPWQSRQ